MIPLHVGPGWRKEWAMALFQGHLPSLPKTQSFCFFYKMCLVYCPALERSLAEARLADNGRPLLVQPGPHSAKLSQTE